MRGRGADTSDALPGLRGEATAEGSFEPAAPGVVHLGGLLQAPPGLLRPPALPPTGRLAPLLLLLTVVAATACAAAGALARGWGVTAVPARLLLLAPGGLTGRLPLLAAAGTPATPAAAEAVATVAAPAAGERGGDRAPMDPPVTVAAAPAPAAPADAPVCVTSSFAAGSAACWQGVLLCRRVSMCDAYSSQLGPYRLRMSGLGAAVPAVIVVEAELRAEVRSQLARSQLSAGPSTSTDSVANSAQQERSVSS